MLKYFSRLSALVAVLSLTIPGHTQALPTATRYGNIQAGMGYTIASPDYGQSHIQGASAFIDYDFRPHIGIEATAHVVAFITPTDLAENTFLAGPRFMYRFHGANFYAKALLGYGDLFFQEAEDHVGEKAGDSLAFAFGGGVDIPVSNHISIRPIDVEVQRWPHFGNGLQPTLYTFGVAYRFHR